MKRILLLSLSLSVAVISLSQKVTPLKCSKYIGVDQLVFDEDNNRYIMGRYKGQPEFFNISSSDKMKSYIAKLKPNNSVVWAKAIEEKRQRYNLVYKDSKLYVLARTQDSDYDAGIKISTAWIETYSSSTGEMTSDNKIAKMEGKGAFIDGRFMPDGLFLFCKWTEDKTAKLNNTNLSKKKYSAVLLQKYSLSGDKLWEHQIEGGFNGFTDIRIGDVDFDEEGNTFIISYFSESLELGNASYKTGLHFDHPTLPLYFTGGFLFKLDKNGNPGKSIELSRYALDYEKIYCHKDKIYLLGYYRGNKAYSDKNEKNDHPVEFAGQTLPDTEINTGTNQPSEDLLIACLDKDFNLIWKISGRSSAMTRAKSLCMTNDTLYVAGITSANASFGTSEINGITGDGYTDAFILAIDQNGNIVKTKTFSGPGSVSSSIFADKSGELIGTVYFNKEYVTIDGEKISRFCGSANELIYDFHGHQTPTVTKTHDGSPTSELKVGDRVQGNWKGQGRYYSGKIGKIEGDRYFIQYDDGDTEWTTIDYIKKL